MDENSNHAKQRVGSKRPWRFGDVSQQNNQPRTLAQSQSSFANTYLYFVLSNSLLYIYIYTSLYFKVFFHFLQILSLFLCLSHIHTHSLVFGIYFALDSRSSFSANQLGLSTTLFPQVNDSFFFPLWVVWFQKKNLFCGYLGLTFWEGSVDYELLFPFLD